MRLELVLLPDAMDRIFAHTLLPRQCASAPVRRSLGLSLERSFDNASYLGFAIKRFASPAWSNIPNSTDSLFTNPVAPERRGASLQFEFVSNLLVRLSLGGPENDPGSKHNLLGR